jgi:hypothetical protein
MMGLDLEGGGMAFTSVRRFVAVAALTTAVTVCGSGVALVSAGAAVLPVVKVSPSTGLVDLQKVTVTGSGFNANAGVATIECPTGTVNFTTCDLSTLVIVSADKHGAFTVTRYVRRLITADLTTTGKTIDCAAPAGCVLGAVNISNFKQANGGAIFFNPKIPPQVPTMTVTPDTKLVDHQLVTVSGKD